MYEGESDLFELGAWLKTIGYVLHTFHHEHKSCMTPYAAEDNQQAAKHQILRLSAVFMPDPISWPSLDKDRLLNLAFLSQAIYKSSDIAMRALYVLDSRDSGSLVDSFRSYLDLASLDA